MFHRRIASFILVLPLLLGSLKPYTVNSQEVDPPIEIDSIKTVMQTISAGDPPAEDTSRGGPPGLGGNWIVNGDAEIGTTMWTGGPNDFISPIAYGTYTTPYPNDPGPANRGSYLFRGQGTNPEKNAWQTFQINTTGYNFSSGLIHYTLSGYLGGLGNITDNAILRVYFGTWNTSTSECNSFAQDEIGPVTNVDRHNQTGLLKRSAEGFVPAGTQCFTFQLQMFIHNETSGVAFADNLSFVLDGAQNFLPMIIKGAAQPVNSLPLAPTNLVVAEQALTSLKLTWNDNSSNETGFLLERAPGNSSVYSELAQLGSNTTSYQDNSLPVGTSFKYRVSAFNGKGPSGYASVTGTTLSAPTVPPTTPASCWTTDTGATSTILGWTDSSSNEEYFILNIKLPGYDWLHLANVEPNATYVTIVDLPTSATTYFRIWAHNSAGNSSGYCETSVTTGSLSNLLTITNTASYPVIFLEIDGIDQFPVYPMALITGNYYQIYLDPGYHTITAATGFWSSKTDRFFMYSYFFDFNLTSGGNLELEIPDIPIENLLTQFSDNGQGYWEGYYFDIGGYCHTAAFRFFSNKTYTIYDGGIQIGSGGYDLAARLPATYSVKFNVWGHENYQGWLFETEGFFYMSNGPASWSQITYVYKPQGYVYNSYCP